MSSIKSVIVVAMLVAVSSYVLLCVNRVRQYLMQCTVIIATQRFAITALGNYAMVHGIYHDVANICSISKHQNCH